MDRQTFLFIIIMFIFLSFPGGEQPVTREGKDTLTSLHNELIASRETLFNSTYTSGYGNVTGFQLSYQDRIDGKNISDWPIHKYSRDHPWQENEQYSILPNIISDRVKGFWGLLKSIPEKENEPQNPLGIQKDTHSYLLNISGVAYGEFERLTDDLVPVKLDIPQYLRDYYLYYNEERYRDQKERYDNDPENNPPPDEIPKDLEAPNKIGNLTKSTGQISINIKGYDYNYKNKDMSKFIYNETDVVDDAVVVLVNLNLKDYEEIEDHALETEGIYFQDSGSLVVVSQSAKFLANSGLSHLAMNEDNFNKSKKLMSQFLNTTNIERDVGMDEMNTLLSRSFEKCEVVAYFQLEKTKYSQKELRFIDEELRNPAGRPLPKELPDLVISDYLIYSPDCGVVYNKKKDIPFVGLKSEVLRSQRRMVLIGLLALVGIQLALFLRQIKETRTPGQLSGISAKTLYIIGLQDSLIALIFLLISTLSEELFLLLACIAVVSFIMCGFFELRFMVSVLSTQVNERGTTWWEILRGGTAGSETTGNGTENNTEGPILPTTNTPAEPAVTVPTTPITTASEEQTFSNSIFVSGMSLTIVGMFLILNSMMWRTKYRRIFEYVGFLGLNSYWIPQFLRNTLKNRRKTFSWEFILATSYLRLLPVYYLALYKNNPLRHHYDPVLALVVTNWISLQIFLLFLQSRLGPRFWVNENWLPKAYDYQQVLEIKDLENGGFASDILAGIKPENTHDGIIETTCTCPICMTAIPLPILADGSGEARKKINNKKDYMITPCHHIFHHECLESWMKYKLQCPVCRDSLPPI